MKPNDIMMSTLLRALALKRPYGSKEDGMLVASLLNPRLAEANLQWVDGAGNLHTDLRDGFSKTLFVAHSDTVHRTAGVNHFTQLGKMIHAGNGPTLEPEGLNKKQRRRWWAQQRTTQFHGEPLGADDAVGVAILAGMMAAKIPGYYIITRGEERGGIGSTHLVKHHEELLVQFDRAIAIDRRDTWSVITHQFGGRCCSDAFAEALSSALNEQGMLYMPDDSGVYTDTAEFIDLIPECTNLSAGYYSEHTSMEHVDIEHVNALFDAVRKVDWETLPTLRDPHAIHESAFGHFGGAYPERGWWSGLGRGPSFDTDSTHDEVEPGIYKPRIAWSDDEIEDELNDPFYFDEYPHERKRK